MKFITLLILSVSFAVHSKAKLASQDPFFPDANDTISCGLDYLSAVRFDGKKISHSSHKEKAKTPTVFTNLKSDKPLMIQPDKMQLVKIKEHNGIYWLASAGVYAVVLFILDTKRKIFIQQRSSDFFGNLSANSWIGRCL